MKHLDLFSGIGGFALAASWVWGTNHKIESFCEIEPGVREILSKHWPDTPIHEDITTMDFSKFKDIDLITGGFPCQDISNAGKCEGIGGKRSGLWRYLHSAISTIQPRYVVIENVSALIVRGLGTVLSDLASIGYDAEWENLSAYAFGASHIRKRLWIVAYPGGKFGTLPVFGRNSGTCKERHKGEKVRSQNRVFDQMGPSPLKRLHPWDIELAEPKLLTITNGVSPPLGEIRGYGNAIVPQVARGIFEAIKQTESGVKPPIS